MNFWMKITLIEFYFVIKKMPRGTFIILKKGLKHATHIFPTQWLLLKSNYHLNRISL